MVSRDKIKIPMPRSALRSSTTGGGSSSRHQHPKKHESNSKKKSTSTPAQQQRARGGGIVLQCTFDDFVPPSPSSSGGSGGTNNRRIDHPCACPQSPRKASREHDQKLNQQQQPTVVEDFPFSQSKQQAAPAADKSSNNKNTLKEDGEDTCVSLSENVSIHISTLASLNGSTSRSSSQQGSKSAFFGMPSLADFSYFSGAYGSSHGASISNDLCDDFTETSFCVDDSQHNIFYCEGEDEGGAGGDAKLREEKSFPAVMHHSKNESSVAK